MNRRFWSVVVLASLLALAARAEDAPPPAGEASEIGRSIFIANDVDGKTGDGPAKRIAVNDDIVFEEDIATGDDAKAVIEFRDGSTFEIGPDAAVRIDSFVFNPEESTSHKALSVTHGVFRYVSGYAAGDQETRIKTPSGNMGIRGSVAAGIVDPAVPDFLYLGEGSATFTNSAGSSTLQPGNSIAVPSDATPPMAPASMPAPVAAQALQAIETRLPPRTALANRPAADEAWLKRAGAANLVPATEQQRIARAAASTARPLAAPGGSSRLASELGLLVEGNRVNLFTGRQTMRTPEQTAFLARAARENSNAGAVLRRFTADSGTMHRSAMTAGTALVIQGVGRAAPSAAVMRRVTAAATRANPGAAALIQRHAGESYRGADRGELARPGRQPSERRETAPNIHGQQQRERPPRAQPQERNQRQQGQFQRQPQGQFQRQQQGQFQRPPQERQQQLRRFPGPPPRQPQEKRPPPRKRGDERDQNQR